MAGAAAAIHPGKGPEQSSPGMGLRAASAELLAEKKRAEALQVWIRVYGQQVVVWG